MESSNPQKSRGIRETDYFKLKIREASIFDNRIMSILMRKKTLTKTGEDPSKTLRHKPLTGAHPR